ncbi:hypothetical protein CO683_40915 [Bradyrhizobium ottawaense]|uniref:hypothetical protein n=1 Tax=Bradyrhizobium ottawaense TaxID=931866 RepID=UPI000BEA93A1|nr:hypothetical protein [Bradyrhizobium ottawaense]PDT64005.1 hypothetical protein CO683_40915 [Bradyrhizobium ottawaense]
MMTMSSIQSMTSIQIVFAVLSTAALAQEPVTKENCKPQPSCRLDYLDIQPGAPGPGLKPQGDVAEKPGIIVNGISKGDLRNNYRLPEMMSNPMGSK